LGFGLVGAGAAALSWALLSAFHVTLFAADAIVFQYIMTVAAFPLFAFIFSRWQQAFLKLD
ncbi:MAG: rod shape-determining protein MreD, partial [Magnetovibrio sp.]|nr:rod shape-determining protein MreD [Magnetovibrio sp.]